MFNEEVKNYIQEMLSGEFDDSHGEKESKVVQALRVTNQADDIDQICTAIAAAGSWYALPVLFARFADYRNGPSGMSISNAILAIKDRLEWSEDFKNELFTLSFWKLKWEAGHGRFLSFISLLSQDIMLTREQENLAEQIMREINYDLHPYDSFTHMKLSLADWKLEEDLTEVLCSTKSEQNLNEILEELKLPKGLESITESTFVSLRNDYLITRLGLADNFSLYLPLFDAAIRLNKKA